LAVERSGDSAWIALLLLLLLSLILKKISDS
jgi:hypothetical protein